METKDILIYETGDGGDFDIQNGDLALAELIYQQVYLALFGGNIEANTVVNTLITEQRFDYWANNLIYSDNPSLQFNSNTERTLRKTALTSSGRIEIMRAIELDLSYLQNVVNKSVDAQIIGNNKIRMIIVFTEKTNQQDRTLQLIWDNSKSEIIIEKTI